MVYQIEAHIILNKNEHILITHFPYMRQFQQNISENDSHQKNNLFDRLKTTIVHCSKGKAAFECCLCTHDKNE